MRGGNGYGVGDAIAPGALSYVPNMTSVPGGAAYTPTGGRRRRRGGAVDLDAPPVVGDIVDSDGSKLFPEQQCVAAGRTWGPVLYGYTLTDTGNGLLGVTGEIADPKNDNGDPLGACSGTKPPPNMGPTAPRADGGRRRRSRRRRGGADPIYAVDGRKLVLQSECGSRPELWMAASVGFPSLPINYAERIENPMRDGRPLGQCDMAQAASAPGGPGEEAAGDIIVGRRGKHNGGRRSRRKSKGRRRRTMRGGGSVAGVGYGFAGDGARGLAIPQAYPSNLPVGGAFAIPDGTR